VVVPLQLHAVGDSGLFQQVGLDISTGNSVDVCEVNTDEFTLLKIGKATHKTWNKIANK